ncbi:hypothetical protein [Pseudomonas moraviensis]|uniref:Uncharacterized protein n=1 Tax=Pseudomonas moraviensis TaxID=321662 RepID=A0A7Y9VTT8_9PSED|nr:hypothetical protein [Pseudomonas moraviensis]NYH08087.1 hypothetical protein [Pseudomonas moraviensis]
MTAQQKALNAPILKEAEAGVLHVHKLKDHATAQIFVTAPNVKPGDKIDLTVKTTTGNAWNEQIIVRSVPSVLESLIEKDIFAKNLTSGASAKLSYTVTTASGGVEHSDELVVKLEQ